MVHVLHTGKLGTGYSYECRQPNSYVLVEQQGKNTYVQLGGKGRLLKNCDALKLANTLFGRDTPNKYPQTKMDRFGFMRRI